LRKPLKIASSVPYPGISPSRNSWLLSWQEGITEEQAMERAEHFMLAMPAWAED